VSSPRIALLSATAALLVGSLAPRAAADPTPDAEAEAGGAETAPFAKGIGERSPGRPTVRLDRLEFLPNVPVTNAIERHVRFALRKAARRADWGAGRKAKIEFRVTVEELSVSQGDGVVRVRCTALGRLPKGKSARSRIEFSGRPNERQKIVFQVLEVVARGVVTRLAALERERRIAAQKG
jgi:hypothetical protein